MGIRGTVRRSTDGDFIHSNIDIDLLIDEEREIGKDLKPKELFHIVERFCQGKPRLVSIIHINIKRLKIIFSIYLAGMLV